MRACSPRRNGLRSHMAHGAGSSSSISAAGMSGFSRALRPHPTHRSRSLLAEEVMRRPSPSTSPRAPRDEKSARPHLHPPPPLSGGAALRSPRQGFTSVDQPLEDIGHRQRWQRLKPGGAEAGSCSMGSRGARREDITKTEARSAKWFGDDSKGGRRAGKADGHVSRHARHV